MWRYFYSPLIFGMTFFLGRFFPLWYLRKENTKKEKVFFFSFFAIAHYLIIFLSTYVDGVLLSAFDFWSDLFFLKYALIYFVDRRIRKVVGKTNWATSVFIVNIGHCFQHSCQYFYQIITLLSGIARFSLSGALIRVAFRIGYTLIFYLLTRKRLRNIDSAKIKQNSFRVFSTLIIVFFTIIGNSYFWTIASKSDVALYFELSILVFTGFIAVLLIAWQISILRNVEREADLITVKKRIHEQKSYYEREKAVMDALNIKSHDLKHQRNSIKTRISQEDYDEMEKRISSYDTFVKTGNKAVDIILTEKEILCQSKNIRFTARIDGEKLSFIRENDIYALLGNILDNAIEASEKRKKDEERVVSISTISKEGFIRIHEENFFDGDLIYENNVLKTTKQNKLYHGFGVKSIKLIAEKYHGDVSISAKDGKFILDILFPIQK